MFIIVFCAVIWYNTNMKTKDCSVEADEKPLYRLGRHWNTIQAYLLPGIEDDIGELGEVMRS